jgi:anion-transporting  ArsA/GET3 family ATPase
MRLDDLLARLQLIVVTGKGGVGKTAVACTLGRLLAAAGRRTLVLEVDPRDNVHQMLGVSPSGGEILPAGGLLWAQNLRPEAVLDTIVRERLRVPLLAKRVLASPVYAQFSAGAPGLRELAILGHALRLLRGTAGPAAPRLETVVLDAPATGHGLRLLRAPQLVADVIHDGPFGEMAAELATWLGTASAVGVVVATQAEEMPATEALELIGDLERDFGRPPLALVVNALYPPLPTAGDSALEATSTWTLWRERRRLNERELAHLRADWLGPLVELPLLAKDRGPELVAALGRCLAPSLGTETAAEAPG